MERLAQALLELADAAIAARRIAVERPFDHADKARRDVRSQVAEGLPQAIRMPARQLVHRRRNDRERSRDEVEEHDADTVDVALDRRLLAAEDLRRQIERRTNEAAGAGREVLSGAEVHQDDATAGFAHDVLRLDVAVQQAGIVDGRERGADVEADERSLAGAERSARGDNLVERFPAHELGPQAHTAIVLFGAVDLDNVLVPQARQTTGLVHQTTARIAASVDGVVLMQQFQRDVPVELRVPGAEDVTGGSLADVLEDDQASPTAAIGSAGRRGWYGDVGGRDTAMEGGDVIDEAQVPDNPALAARSCGLNRLPVDRAAVRHRCSEVRERAIVSPQQAGSLTVGH